MGSTQNQTTISDEEPVEDRISELPDYLRSEILYHLSTKDAVRTSVLSTKWRSIRQLVPVLDLDSNTFSNLDDFVSFTDRFFDPSRDSLVRKLRLNIYTSADDMSFLNRWVDAVSSRGIQHLDLSFADFNGPDMLSIYTCQTLVQLRLFRTTLGTVEVVSLPCLKIICLEVIRCRYEATLEKLISGSPVLEDLTLSRLTTNKAKVLQVRSQTLKRIHISESSAKFLIDAPIVQFLKIKFYSTKNFEIINLGLSTILDIDVVYGHAGLTYDIITDISKVRNLVISHHFWKDIFRYHKRGRELPFSNLSHLNTSFSISNLKMLPNLFEICPILESFVLEFVDPHMRSENMKEPKVIFPKVPECLVSSLKIVELKRSIPGNEGEMKLVRYLLKNATVLEKLKLNVYSTKEEECEFLKELLRIPRCSSVCEIHCSFRSSI